ncbi:hypothetical protein FACS1894186_7820 [Alphaproteobacteria bacterium]|nr:hypothetical protein FACS1894186_7820 [Alphaproteobacteria bacterium]
MAPATSYWLYGRHAALAAVANPRRRVRELFFADPGDIAGIRLPKGLNPTLTDRRAIGKLLPPGAVHQGIAARVEPLPPVSIHDYLETAAGAAVVRVVVLDQVGDPHNVGAILRSAAAFGAGAVITTSRHSPEETAVLAKAASGAAELVPVIAVANLVQAFELLKKQRFWILGLTGGAALTLREVSLPDRLAVVLGAEGSGLRRLTEENCDYLARLPISPKMESLNVSAALACALYDLAGRAPADSGADIHDL